MTDLYTFKHDLRSTLKSLLLTVAFSTLIALFLRFIGVGDTLTISLVMSYSIGISICSLIMIMLFLLRPSSPVSMWGSILAGILLGAFIGWGTGTFILTRIFEVPFASPRAHLFQAMVLGLAFGLIISFFFVAREKLAATKTMMQEERIRRLSSEKDALEANIRLLQAQIEPHFLFNTLSNIRSLIDTDSEKAKAMLMDLNRYLRNTLRRTRCDLTTLGQEAEIVEAYLNIFKIRMGDRLRFSVWIPDALRPLPFPPMLLQPLVENAVQHGLEPKVEGGEVVVRGEETNGHVRLTIADTGEGFMGEPSSGVGLANVRDRLRLLYGERARLILEENTPQGLKAVIEVPNEGPT